MAWDMIGPIHDRPTLGDMPILPAHLLTGMQPVEAPVIEPVFERDAAAAGDLLALEQTLKDRTFALEEQLRLLRMEQELMKRAIVAAIEAATSRPWYIRLAEWVKAKWA